MNMTKTGFDIFVPKTRIAPYAHLDNTPGFLRSGHNLSNLKFGALGST